jgi:hypothetical protein
MFDSSKVNVANLKVDVVKNATAIVICRILRFYLVESANGKTPTMQLFDQEFVYSLVFLLLGFVFYNVAVAPTLNL